jgi:F-type H+-transporting ATPase subunit b
MDMLNLEFLGSQLTWLVISFSGLLFIVWRFIVPNITSTLDARSEKIRQDLDQASRLRSDAEQALNSYEKQIKTAKSEASSIVAKSRAEAKEIAAAHMVDLEIELTKKSDIARKSIEQAKTKALQDVQGQIVEMAMLATEKILLESVDKKQATKITETALKSLN